MADINVASTPITLNVTAIQGDTLDNWSIQFSDAGGAYDISLIDFYYVVKRTCDEDDADGFGFRND